MNWRLLFFIALPVTIFVTAICYSPVSILIFKITEPYFACPVKDAAGKVTIRNDSWGDGKFGSRRSNGRSHAGIDIETPVGTPVYAARSGIAFNGRIPTGYGKYVMIYHPDGYLTMYGHLSDWAVKSVKRVRKGDLIGFTGKSGNANNKNIKPHLHFEIKKDGEALDPRKLMR